MQLLPLHADAHFAPVVVPPKIVQFVLPLLLWLMHIVLMVLQLLKERST
jgi:hypothetical protein